MILDTAAANALERTPAADFLGLRLFHTQADRHAAATPSRPT